MVRKRLCSYPEIISLTYLLYHVKLNERGLVQGERGVVHSTLMLVCCQ